METTPVTPVVPETSETSEASAPALPPEPAAGQSPRRSSSVRRGVKIALLSAAALLGGYLLWSAYMVWLTPDGNLRQIYLVPRDAAIIIQSSEPIADWKRFTGSEPWKMLSRAESMSDVAATVAELEKTLSENRTLLSLVGKRDLIISLHRTRPAEWDFLALVDLRKISKMRLVKNQLEIVMELAGMEVTRREYKGVSIIEMRDPETRDILHLAFVGNHLVCSYSAALVQASIDERDDPQIGLDPAFFESEKEVAGRGLCRVWLNYAQLPGFLSLYMSSPGKWFDAFTGSMDFAGLALEVGRERIAVEGISILGEEPDPYTAALMSSGKAPMKAHSIMPARTAFYANVGFSDPKTFVAELEKALSGGDQAAYDSYVKTRAQLEKYFDISLADDFLGWMSGELAFAELEPGLLGREGEFILAVRARDIKKARESMALIEKRVRGRTPIRVESVDYNGYPINYVEMKGFFRLFFGGLFSRFETPFYTYVDDYVVFSNRSSSLLSFVEDHRQGNLLEGEETFRKALSRAKGSSTVFSWLDTRRFWPLLQPMMTAETRGDLEKNREVVWSFPSMTLQIVADRRTSLDLAMDYLPYENQPTAITEVPVEVDTAAADEADEAMNEEADSERELMSELRRFYVEQFEGNVLREFYDSGAIKSESEVKAGRRHGRYREFYEDGTLLVRGKYSAGKPRGTWKYYTPDGAFDRKERF